ncbi:Gfo/Idh/MocA family oxidoreductase [Aliifodinibius sp. S!AR15-10]|uniref:Gfo/Idh/MocA family protein n=1 Tax=Aliifodinibius sp. S!AR15-10 TaxID=2950437 RepID=UPI0028651879|nr:Gfo/Idh/MocA family oxidoreductase [Aliifodinibius sp. S!AR15-10]MDR8393505.1 Gfo/Idh/MocA family oxidoreductase [Aliifodinibius sp. S!AR15-10]
MSKKTIAFAVCGFGRIGKRHAKIIQEYQEAELAALIDTDPFQQRQVGEHNVEAPFYSSLEEFIDEDDNQADVVNICVPNGLHAPLAVKALENGYHVVIEKPMALSKKQCESIIAASEKSGKKVFVVKQNRYSPPSKWLKEVVSKELLGQIYLVEINCLWNRDERYYKKGDWHGTLEQDGGTLFTQFSHFVDIMHWVFGDVKNISARFQNFNHRDMIEFEDTGIVNFEFVSGGEGTIHYSTSCWDKNMESSMTVIGEKGSLKIGGQYMDEIEYCHIKDYEMPELPPTNPPNDYGPYKGSAANHHYVIENVVDTLNGNSEINTVAEEGMKVVDIIERIYKQRT